MPKIIFKENPQLACLIMDMLDKDQFSGTPDVPEKVVEHLRKAAPWMRFLGIMCCLGVGLVILVAVGSLYYWGSLMDLVILSAVIICLPFAIIVCYALLKSSSSAYRLGETKSQAALEDYARVTRRGWQMAGILVILGIIFSILLCILLLFGLLIFLIDNN
jgi:predicted lysophospholipase L1 biosynthesis ABC-type transport system permease subunit